VFSWLASSSRPNSRTDLRDSVAQFARDVVAPVIGGYYERGEFPYDIVAKMGKLGLFGLPFAEEYDGMGGDYFPRRHAHHRPPRAAPA
jgi:short-chain 2-methylacyl-CoA dehydrogenase